MNATLDAWNKADEETAMLAMLACCGAKPWASAMVALRPIESVIELSDAADKVWATMTEDDWLEAFACHPRIGERQTAAKQVKTAAWSQQEQSPVAAADANVLAELAAGNARYEEKFGFTHIVCATGKTADEMLAILKRRLANDRAAELREAAEQQRQITQIRLGKWLIE
jgi:2-oxo-4-hydroxy-4-carboxy-5-ureidoimidazoline decarboxylase